jgi:hypothetical protein
MRTLFIVCAHAALLVLVCAFLALVSLFPMRGER